MANETHTYFLLLGGNLGNVEACFVAAIGNLKDFGSITATSSIYISEPWGYESKNRFKNQALKFDTNLAPLELLEKTQQIELHLGRQNKTKHHYEDRTIDIDILFYNHSTFEHSKLVVPHPLLHKRDFALLPLSEIAPNYIHPVLNLSVKKMLKALGKHNIKCVISYE